MVYGLWRCETTGFGSGFSFACLFLFLLFLLEDFESRDNLVYSVVISLCGARGLGGCVGASVEEVAPWGDAVIEVLEVLELLA
jgi:hypothetical protein